MVWYVGPPVSQLPVLYANGQLPTVAVCIVLAVASLYLAVARARHATAALLLLTSSGVLFGSLNCGYLAIPPAPHRLRATKVFGIGLSRTGTTSLTVALNSAGINSYHALPHLLDWAADPTQPPRANPHWAAAYDGHTDIQVFARRV
jgi:hypothetical protein